MTCFQNLFTPPSAFQKVRTLSDSLIISYKSSIQAMGQVLDPSRPWDFKHTPQT